MEAFNVAIVVLDVFWWLGLLWRVNYKERKVVFLFVLLRRAVLFIHGWAF